MQVTFLLSQLSKNRKELIDRLFFFNEIEVHTYSTLDNYNN